MLKLQQKHRRPVLSDDLPFFPCVYVGKRPVRHETYCYTQAISHSQNRRYLGEP